MFRKMIGAACVMLLAGLGVTGLASGALADDGAGSVVAETTGPDATTTQDIPAEPSAPTATDPTDPAATDQAATDSDPTDRATPDVTVAREQPALMRVEGGPDAPEAPPTCAEPGASVVSTNLDNNGWTLDGATFIPGGMRFDVSGDWAEATVTRNLVGPLSDLGTGVSYSPDTPYVGLHVLLSNGHYLTYESTYGGKWWSNWSMDTPSVNTGWTLYNLADIVAAHPDLTTQSLVVLYTNPSPASAVVSSVTIGCATYTFDYVPPTPLVCEGQFALPTSTDVDTHGWKFLNGEYVAGGVQLTASGDDAYAYVDLATPIPLSQIGDLSTDYSNLTGSFGILLYNDDVTIHYEGGGEYWTRTSGIFSAQSGATWYQWHNLDNLLSDPLISSIAVWVNNGGSLLLHSQNYGCNTQPFDRSAQPAPVQSDPVDGQWVCGDTTVTQTWTISTTPYLWTPSDSGGSWVASGDPVITAGSGVRELTASEQYPCPATCTTHSTIAASDVDLKGWDFTSETRTSGFAELVDDGLHVWTTDNSSQAKSAGYIATDVPLTYMGDFAINWTGTASEPGGQIRVDVTGDGVWDFTLVVEPVNGDIWWASIPGGHTWDTMPGFPHVLGGGGYPNQGTLQDWLQSFPNASVVQIGYSLGSGVLGDGVISSITAGCAAYTFEKSAQPATIVVSSDPIDGQWVCGDTTVTQTWTISTTTYAWTPSASGGSWVAGDPVLSGGSGIRALTSNELARCVDPPSTSGAAALAATGSDPLGLLGLSGALLLIGGAFVARRTARRRVAVR